MKTHLLLRAALLALALGTSGCITASRVKLRDGERSAEVVLPKEYRATDLDLQLKPDGTLVLRATRLDATAGKLLESAGQAVAEIAGAAK